MSPKVIKEGNIFKKKNSQEKKLQILKGKLKEYQKFIKPEELIKIYKKNSLSLKNIDGISFNPIVDKWSVSKDKSVNYIAKFKKN